jgi:hypothetical protein
MLRLACSLFGPHSKRVEFSMIATSGTYEPPLPTQAAERARRRAGIVRIG